jgi:glucose dehydrogenase
MPRLPASPPIPQFIRRQYLQARLLMKATSKLAPAWAFPIPTSPRLQATPVVVDGVMYMYMTGRNEVYAVDATTGHQIWVYRRTHTREF